MLMLYFSMYTHMFLEAKLSFIGEKRKEYSIMDKGFLLKQKDILGNVARCKTMTGAENLLLIFFP